MVEAPSERAPFERAPFERAPFERGGPAADRAVLEAQLERPLEGRSRVASRCPLALPVVLEVHPDNEGAPFPTLYYLTCPLARLRISRLESAGGVREWAARVEQDPELGAALERAHAAYRAARAGHLPPESPLRARLAGGVAGVARGVKCLHAHYAHARAGGANPVGSGVAAEVEPLDCAEPCVLPDGTRNPAWRERPQEPD
ncbi:MAG: DUF501 domain-containing protein [Planctomycetota bacterium]